MDIKEKINNVSNSIRCLDSDIVDYERIIKDKDNDGFNSKSIIKIYTGHEKPVLDGGFTNLNYTELTFKNEDLLNIISFSLKTAKEQQLKLIEELKNSFE